MHRFLMRVLLGAIALCSACGDAAFGDGRSTNALNRTEPCQKWRALAIDVGCAAPSECAIAERCADDARAFIDCTANDISQCLCESDDGELNCEGAYKPSEGPARCTAEHRKLDTCLGLPRAVPNDNAPEPSSM